ncbi:MAG TPA: glycosyltransferase, partial [Aestuariivirga sp.]|nr:glycosyltransferase [Aestuariivirga sp.]
MKREIWLTAKILSSRPLITVLSISHDDLEAVDILAEGAPEVFDTEPALHLLNLTWTLEDSRVPQFVRTIAEAQKRFPGHMFLTLTATETESFLLAQHGIPSLLASGLIFVDETVWRPRAAEVPGLPMFDAVYSARLDPFKRHELAQGIDRLLLVYGHALMQSQMDAYERVQNILPNAFFANHRLGKVGPLDHDAVCRLYGHSRVGLCLSAVEGCMRASMEYLLAGLPVVSTPSIGGRDRYFGTAYCRVVKATPDALASAVRDLASKRLDRQRIRNHVAQMVGFDRYNFLLNVNKIAKLHLGKD